MEKISGMGVGGPVAAEYMRRRKGVGTVVKERKEKGQWPEGRHRVFFVFSFFLSFK